MVNIENYYCMDFKNLIIISIGEFYCTADNIIYDQKDELNC